MVELSLNHPSHISLPLAMLALRSDVNIFFGFMFLLM